MTMNAFVTTSVVGAAAVFGAIFLTQNALGDKNPVIEVVTEKPAEPTENVVKTKEEWKKELTSEQYRILREAGTERAWSKAYKEFKEQGSGTYICVGCNAELFSSETKFDSGSGWPSFYDVSKQENVKSIPDVSGGYVRTEVRCSKCDGHLGHVFEGEGYKNPTDQRFCINGAVLRFVPEEATETAEAAKTEEK